MKEVLAAAEEPAVAADVVLEAASAPNPKLRYAAKDLRLDALTEPRGRLPAPQPVEIDDSDSDVLDAQQPRLLKHVQRMVDALAGQS
jgi:hypothetical protein